MIRAWKRVPRGIRLTAALVLIPLLLYLSWAMTGFASLSAETAYRRALRRARLPEDSAIQLLLPQTYYVSSYLVAIGTDETGAYRVQLSRENVMGLWRGSSVHWSPAIDGVSVMPLRQDLDRQFYNALDGLDVLYNESGSLSAPVLAVCFPGAAALELELELELVLPEAEWRAEDEASDSCELRLAMLVEPVEGDWFLGAFDPAYYVEHIKSPNQDPRQEWIAHQYFQWLVSFDRENFENGFNGSRDWHGSIRITALDETGSPIRSVRWDPN